MPHRPWSDISLDFVTGLPPSQGYTAILTVDRFSKMVHFIPMRKLPSAKGTAEAVFSHVFWIHGFPKDLVSERGPQFISQVWRAFCSIIGATVSLSPGYHPQSNGQAEQLNQELENCLRFLVSKNPATWSKHLIWVEFSHNTIPSAPHFPCVPYQACEGELTSRPALVCVPCLVDCLHFFSPVPHHLVYIVCVFLFSHCQSVLISQCL